MLSDDAYVRSSRCDSNHCLEAAFKRSPFCDTSSCVEAAHRGGTVLVRDSKWDGGPVLVFDPASWRALLCTIGREQP